MADSDKTETNFLISCIHGRYVQEVAKIEFLTKGLEGMLDSIPVVEGINLNGFVLAMKDAIKGINDLNNELDQTRFGEE